MLENIFHGIRSKMSWHIVLAKTAEKQLRKFPKKETQRIIQAIDAMLINPLGSDVVKLEGLDNSWRRRIGDYRVIFELSLKKRVILVYEITRRTSKTY